MILVEPIEHEIQGCSHTTGLIRKLRKAVANASQQHPYANIT
jgi:hypothetical protein